MAASPGFLALGTDSYQVPLRLFQENREKLVVRLVEAVGGGRPVHSRRTPVVVVLEGGASPTRYDTDHEPIFRQESYFWWLTGVKEPDCSVAMTIRTTGGGGDNNGDSNGDNNNGVVTTATTTLFIPRLPPSYATIMGRIKTKEEWRETYQVDEVLFIDELEAFLEEQLRDSGTSAQDDGNGNGDGDGARAGVGGGRPRLLLMKGVNTDSGRSYDPGPVLESEALHRAGAVRDVDTLFPVLAECRVRKSRRELALLEHVAQVSSFAHAYVMRNVRPGMHEYQCEALFRHYAHYNHGCRLVPYTPICGCGPNGAVLHYGHAGEPNARRIEDGDSCLFDMGAEYLCYASDVTCSFPASGTFTAKYRAVYEAVLDAQRAVYRMMEPGVSWVDCHIAAELEIVRGMHRIGVVTLPPPRDDSGGGGDDLDEAATVQALTDLVRTHRLGAVFMPHGLGHLLGIDTHDVGGYLPGHPERSPLPGLKSLRTARVLEEAMVLTVEPGCYFIDHLLDEALQHPVLARYLNADLIEAEYRGYGGVRLEDVVAVTSKEEGGCINFTLCPRTVAEVEHVMGGGKWPPLVDGAPELRRVKLTSPISPLPPPPSL